MQLTAMLYYHWIICSIDRVFIYYAKNNTVNHNNIVNSINMVNAANAANTANEYFSLIPQLMRVVCIYAVVAAVDL